MKKVVLTILVFVLFIACDKDGGQREDATPRIPSIPEQVEADLAEIVSHDWAVLADTVGYFYDNLLSQGQFSGFGPDGVWYELDVKAENDTLFATFNIADSTWFTAQGTLDPLRMDLIAYSSVIGIEKARGDSVSFCANDIKVTAPAGFGLVEGKTCTLYYFQKETGFIDIEEFENDDYSTGDYLVVHYTDDPRTFSFYDNGFISLMDGLDAFR